MPEAAPSTPGSLFPQLRDARLVKRLADGRVADSWLYETSGGAMVLRRDRPVAARLGLDRRNEWRVLQAMAEQGLGPIPVACDERQGLLLTRYQPGETWAGLQQPARCHVLGRLLRRVHEAPLVGKHFDPATIARTYARALPAGDAAAMAEEARHLSSRLYAGNLSGCLCHHDAHAGNVVGDGRQLLDWEYAAVGLPWMDLAVVVRFHALDDARTAALIEGWCDGADGLAGRRWAGFGAEDVAGRLPDFARLYDVLACLWQRVVDSDRHAGKG